MNKIYATILTLLLLPVLALAQDNISQSTGIIGNGRLLGAKTYDGQTTVGVLGIDSSGNTSLQAMSGKVVTSPGITTSGSITVNGGNLIFGTAGTGLKQGMSTLAAAGSTQADAAAITNLVTRVTGADGTKGVALPTLANYTMGMNWFIINSDTTNALKVYSFAAGQTITGQAGTTAISVAAKTMLHCINYDQTTNWYCDKLATPY